MRSPIRVLAALATATFLGHSTPALADGPLATPAGTWSLSGSAIVGDLIVSGGDAAFAINLSPGFGYFIFDNGELFADVSFAVVIAGGSAVTGVTFLPGFRYFFGQTGLRPYVQAALLVGAVQSVGVFGGQVGGGVLVPIHDNIGIDLGLRANFMSQGGVFVLDVPFGAIGVRAFIPPAR